jgi:hypothetical protein
VAPDTIHAMNVGRLEHDPEKGEPVFRRDNARGVRAEIMLKIMENWGGVTRCVCAS